MTDISEEMERTAADAIRSVDLAETGLDYPTAYGTAAIAAVRPPD
jgi:hypothetical protein